MKTKQTLLVFRFSAFGDVAMTVPVIKEFLIQNPDTNLIYISRNKFSALFDGIENLTFYPADLDGQHKGILGLYQLAKDLKKLKPDYIVDLHNVLRTKILKIFLSDFNTATLDKARSERKALVRSKNKIRQALKPMVERYADVFRKLRFQLELSHQLKSKSNLTENSIGIAPFAMYAGKMYPLEKMRTVALKIAENGTKVYLFGGGNKEKFELDNWEKLHPNIQSMVGKLNLKEELDLIAQLKLMVSMDSANMHLASLVGTPVISIWGNTHPFMGFLGYGQSMDDVIQDESLLIRPTSVFGKEPKGMEKVDYFKNISEELALEKIQSKLKSLEDS